jgi:hypothetical protein
MRETMQTMMDGTDKNVASQRKLAQKINSFVRRSIDGRSELPTPDNGDCWYCLMFDREMPRNCSNGTDHLLSHLEEDYLPGALIMNALTWAGYSEPALIFAHENDNLKRGRKADTVKRALRRYLRRRLGIG